MRLGGSHYKVGVCGGRWIGEMAVEKIGEVGKIIWRS